MIFCVFSSYRNKDLEISCKSAATGAKLKGSEHIPISPWLCTKFWFVHFKDQKCSTCSEEWFWLARLNYVWPINNKNASFCNKKIDQLENWSIVCWFLYSLYFGNEHSKLVSYNWCGTHQIKLPNGLQQELTTYYTQGFKGQTNLIYISSRIIVSHWQMILTWRGY